MSASGSRARAGSDAGGLAVADVVRRVVAEAAPAELPVAEGLGRLGDDRAARLLRRSRRRGSALGFGTGEIAILVTPVVWAAVDEVVRRSADGAVGSLGSRLRRLFRRRPRAVPPAPLTAGQLSLVASRVRELAGKAGMEAEQAEALADRVVAQLVLPRDVPTGDGA